MQWYHLCVIQGHNVPEVQEDFHPFTYVVDEIHTKGGVSHEGLVTLLIETVVVTGPHGHGPTKWPFYAQVITLHLQEVLCTVPYFLHGDDHADCLVQQLPGLLLDDAVLYHLQQDLEPLCVGGHWWVLVHIGGRWWVLICIGEHWWVLVVIGGHWWALMHVGGC